MLHIDLISRKTQEIIHEKSLEILEKTGVRFNHGPALEMLETHGAKIDGQMAYFPTDLVEKCLATCPETFTLEARNSEKNAVFGKKDGFLVLPNLGPVFIQELSGKKRRGTMADYINVTRLSHTSPIVDVVGSCPIDAADADPDTKFLEMIYQSFRHSDKPVMCCTAPTEQTDQQLALMEIAFDQPGIMKDKTITGTSLSPLSPLAYSEDAAHALMAYGSRRQMVIIAGAPMAGISSPVTIAGTGLMINTEFLAGMVLAQCAGPGAPMVYATTASAGNLRNATYVTGIPETGLLNCFAAQMGQYYKIPSRSVGAVTDAKTIDMQAGYDAMQNLLLAGLSGIDAIYETLGTLDSLMSVSYEKFMIDLELLSRVKTICKGVDQTVDQLFVKEIQDIGSGGNFLTHPSTFKACRQRWSPTVSDWWTYDKWLEGGSKDVICQASDQYQAIIGQEPQILLDEPLDKKIKTYIESFK